MATPEYMCPEILNYILYENQLNFHQSLLKYLNKYSKPWVIDVWSIGCVILEIISGIPLWMSLKTIVTKKGKESIQYGLFAVKGRYIQ
jgi:dual specificity tyrosine-phosphorylation-regulated kinase 2/3/4